MRRTPRRRARGAQDGEAEPGRRQKPLADGFMALLLNRIVRLEAAVDQMSTNNASLTVAAAAAEAADTITSVAGQQHTRVEAVASDLSARLTQQVEDSFKSAVETGVAAHAEMIGTRLNAQLEERLNLARETVASLGV